MEFDPVDDPAHEAVRRLLADARHTEPMPPEVVARLDRVLADLHTNAPLVEADPLPVVEVRAQRASKPHEPTPTNAPVIDLASRRRRRAASLLVAAAFVVVGGVGSSQIFDRDSEHLSADRGDNASALEADSEAPAESATEDGAAASPEAGAGASDHQSDTQANTQTERGGENASPEPAPARSAPLELRSRGLRGDVRRLLDLDAAYDASGVTSPVPNCYRAAWGEGIWFAATYDGLPSALVLRTPVADRQTADLYLCDRAVRERTLSLPTP